MALFNRKLIRGAACVCLAAVTALSLAACGGSGSGGSGSGDSAEHDLTARDYSEYMTLGQHSGMDIAVDPLEPVTDEAIQEQIDTIRNSMATSERITEGVTAVGDTIDFDFTGYRDGEAFEGGSAQGYEYTIGSGQFIEDLDTQLAGLTIGETYDLECTFPEDYHSEDLAGVTVTFEVVVNAILGEAQLPEWTDELAAQYSGGAYSTTADYEAYLRETLEDSASTAQHQQYIENVWNAVLDNCEFQGLPEDEVSAAQEFYYNNVVDYYTQFAAQYGMDVDETGLAEVLAMFGTSEEDLEDYAHSMAESEVRAFMVANMICIAEDIDLDEAEYMAQMTEDATSYGYESFEAFEEEAGRGYLTDTYKYTLVLEWLQENNHMVESAQAETEAAAETPAG